MNTDPTEGKVVGEYFADMLIDGKVIVEIKAGKYLAPEHEAQFLNYLRATDVEVGLLLNFGPKPQVKRKVFDNIRKQFPCSSARICVPLGFSYVH